MCSLGGQELVTSLALMHASYDRIRFTTREHDNHVLPPPR